MWWQGNKLLVRPQTLCLIFEELKVYISRQKRAASQVLCKVWRKLISKCLIWGEALLDQTLHSTSAVVIELPAGLTEICSCLVSLLLSHSVRRYSVPFHSWHGRAPLTTKQGIIIVHTKMIIISRPHPLSQ